MRLIVFGDSVAVGQFVSPHQAWVTLMAQQLPDWLVMNAGRNGDTTRGALERMAYDVLSHHPDLVIVQFGLNDCNTWDGHPRVSGPAFSANLVEIVNRADCPVILVANHRMDRDHDYDRAALAYNRRIREAAATTGSLLVDIEPLAVELLDGIHPTPIGHRKYAEAIVGAIPAERAA